MVVDAFVLNVWLYVLAARKPRYAGGRPPQLIKPFCLAGMCAFARATIYTLMVLAGGAIAATPNIEGGWQTREGKAKERDTMTVRALGNNLYEVEVRTVYCPRSKCMNARFGGFAFQSPLIGTTLSYKASSCSVDIRFSSQRARVGLTGCKSADAYPYGGPRGSFTKFSDDPAWNRR